MALNWTSEVLLGFISTIPIIIAAVITLYNFIKSKYIHLLVLMVGWICLMFWCLFLTLANLFLSLQLAILCNYMLIGVTFAVIVFLDLISRESIDPIKLTITSVLSVSLIFTSLYLGAVYEDELPFGGRTVLAGGAFSNFIMYISVFSGILMIFYYYKLLRKSPPQMKGPAILCFTGCLFATALPFIGAIFLYELLPANNMIFVGISSLIISIAFVREPTLAYILPFKASRLTILDTRSGIPIYDYFWIINAEEADEMIFSGMIQGITGIMNEAVKKGNIKEIRMTHGVLLIEWSTQVPIALVLVSNKSTSSLRMALKSMIEDIADEYENDIEKITNPKAIARMESFIKSRFSFIPAYSDANSLK